MDICYNCFRDREGYEVCPHCGHLHSEVPEQEFHLYPGTVLNERYLIGVVLGFGGFGVTYKAWDMQMRSMVAIKEFFPSGLVNRVPGEKELLVFDGTEKENYKEYIERFLDEAKNLAQFNGKANIVNVFGFFEENNTAYIVMEYLDGQSLKSYVEQFGKIPADTALVIATYLLTGTGEVHAKGILHRDIAPDNIMLTNEGDVKILDFGSARFSSDNNEKTLSAFVKPGFAAPEQYAARGEQGVWTDIYGIGATLYYMLTAQRLDEATDRQREDTAKRPSELGIELPEEMDKAVMKSIALPIELRFHSTDEFLAALSGEYKIDYPDVEVKKKKRRRLLAAVMAVASIVAAVALSFYIYNRLQVDIFENIQDGTEIEVWVYADNAVYDEGKSNMDEGFKETVKEAKDKKIQEQRQAYANMQQKFNSLMMDNYGINVDAKIKVYNNKQSYTSAINKAVESNKLPDVFMVADSYDILKEHCRDLSEFAEIFGDRNEYKFITESNYKDIYPSQNLIPLGFKAPVVFANENLLSDYGLPDKFRVDKFNSLDNFTLLDAYADKANITSFSKGKTVQSKLWGIDKVAYGVFMETYNASLVKDDFSPADSSTIGPTEEKLRNSYEKNKFNNRANIADYFYYGQLAYFVADTSLFESVNDYMGGNYTMKAMLSPSGNALVQLDDEIAVNKEIDENHALLARALVEYMLSDNGQAYLDIVIGNALPLHKNTFEQFVSFNGNYDIIKENYDDAAALGEKGFYIDMAANELYETEYKGLSDTDLGKAEKTADSGKSEKKLDKVDDNEAKQELADKISKKIAEDAENDNDTEK